VGISYRFSYTAVPIRTSSAGRRKQCADRVFLTAYEPTQDRERDERRRPYDQAGLVQLGIVASAQEDGHRKELHSNRARASDGECIADA
jgi:hypothetical protein